MDEQLQLIQLLRLANQKLKAKLRLLKTRITN